MTPNQTNQLWLLLVQTWGSKFAEQYGSAPNEAWKFALANCSVEQAKFALQALIHSGAGFPPTLPEFVALTRKHRSETVCERLLPVQGVSEEKRQENIKRLREALKGIH